MIHITQLENIPYALGLGKEHLGDRYYGGGLIPIPEKEEVPVKVFDSLQIERYESHSNALRIRQWRGSEIIDQICTSGLSFIGQVKIFIGNGESDNPYCILVDAVGRRNKVELTPDP